MEEALKKKLMYLLSFLIGAVIGMTLIDYLPDSMHIFKNGIFNWAIYGAIGFGICALVYKEYKKLWVVPLIIIIGLVFTFPVLYILTT